MLVEIEVYLFSQKRCHPGK